MTEVKPLSDDESERLQKCADSIPTDDAWFTLGDPWLGRGMETQVIARSADPHVAIVVCDMIDVATAGHEDEFTDDEWTARNWANAEFIATFDPPTVKRLLATITALKSENARLREALELMLTHGEYSNWFANRGDEEVVDQARAALTATNNEIGPR